MKTALKIFTCATVAFLLSFHSSRAATIIRLDLGDTGPDLTYSGGNGGVLSTMSDGGSGTGEQATAILYTDFLSSLVPNPTTGSYTLSNVTAVGLPTFLGGGTYLQNFNGGNYKLYDSANVLLLDVNLGMSLLVGGANGGHFSVTNGTVVGGAPAITSQLVSNSLGFSTSLSNINGGGGLSTGIDGYLNSFVTNASLDITATQVPEPAAVLLALGTLVAPMALRRRR